MKKLFAIFALFLAFTSSAFANSVTVEATQIRDQAKSLTVVPSFDAYGFTFDARLNAARSDRGFNTNSFEGRVQKDFPVYQNLTGFVRAGVGREYANVCCVIPTYNPVSVTNTFYSIEPGVKFALTPKVTLKLSDRYTNVFQDHARYNVNHEFGLGAEYAVTSVDAIGVKYLQNHGDVNGKGVRLSYTRSF